MPKLLVIDDEPAIRGLLETLLVRKGYTVSAASSGAKGLELFRRERPDAVILDLRMEGMDGLAVLQELRKLDGAKPVIILTGAGTEQLEYQARLLGASAFVEKQFSLHELGHWLKVCLGNEGAIAAPPSEAECRS